MSNRVLLLCLAAGALLPAADTVVIEQIIAKVNGEIITRSEIDRMKKAMVDEMKARGATAKDVDEALKEREKDFLREKIDSMLLAQKGRDLNINLDAAVTKYIANLQRQSKIADPEKFQAYIRENTGMLYEEKGRGILAQRGQKTEIGEDGKPKVTGSVGDSNEIQATIKDEQWNDYKIVAKGNHVQHFINGKPTADVTDNDTKNAPKEGILALQIHAGPAMVVQFKGLVLKTE